jgi:hypothetical protein
MLVLVAPLATACGGTELSFYGPGAGGRSTANAGPPMAAGRGMTNCFGPIDSIDASVSAGGPVGAGGFVGAGGAVGAGCFVGAAGSFGTAGSFGASTSGLDARCSPVTPDDAGPASAVGPTADQCTGE